MFVALAVRFVFSFFGCEYMETRNCGGLYTICNNWKKLFNNADEKCTKTVYNYKMVFLHCIEHKNNKQMQAKNQMDQVLKAVDKNIERPLRRREHAFINIGQNLNKRIYQTAIECVPNGAMNGTKWKYRNPAKFSIELSWLNEINRQTIQKWDFSPSIFHATKNIKKSIGSSENSDFWAFIL